MPHSAFVDRYGHMFTVEPNGCWEWQHAKDSQGYPRATVCRHLRFVSHISLEMDGKPRTDAKPCALHTCDNKRCVNPDHLWWGTLKENSQDMSAKGRAANQHGGQRQRHCKSGHEYTLANTYWRPTGQRDCRTCIRHRVKRYQNKDVAA